MAYKRKFLSIAGELDGLLNKTAYLLDERLFQSSIAQFVNALVCYKLGRNYFNNRSVIRMLTWGDIGRDNVDPIMGDNLIGIMMKLSCSRFQRSDMIKNGLVRWLLQRMEEDEYSATKYRLQCMAGLLRNLLRGYNLDDLSPIEMQRLIVLLGEWRLKTSCYGNRSEFLVFQADT